MDLQYRLGESGWQCIIDPHRETHISSVSGNDQKDEADYHGIGSLEGDYRLVHKRKSRIRECGNNLKQRKPGDKGLTRIPRATAGHEPHW